MKTAPLIQSSDSLRQIVETLKNKSMIGLDTEFIRETTFFPKIALIQVACEDETYLIDPLALDKQALSPLLELLTDSRILKIVHAAFADQECLYWAYGITAAPVLDTAIAAALCGFGDNIGLAKLLKEVCRVHLPKGRSRVKWLARPLPKELVHYASEDVAHLVRLGQTLWQRLKAQDRLEWAIEESVVPVSGFDVTAEELAERVAKGGHLDAAAYPVLVELFRWREERARTANLPRAWVAGNEVLLALAKSRPRSVEELSQFRGLNAKEVARHGEKILAAIRRGLEALNTRLPVEKRSPPVSSSEDHALDLLKAYVAFLSAEHSVATRFLVTPSRAVDLLRSSDSAIEDWVLRGILSRHAARLVGEELKALLSGQRALSLKGGKVEVRRL